jgi:hypothetical protein
VAEYIGTLKPFHSVTMRLNITDETLVAEPLREIAADMGSNVEVGSYPVTPPFQPSPVGVMVAITHHHNQTRFPVSVVKS